MQDLLRSLLSALILSMMAVTHASALVPLLEEDLPGAKQAIQGKFNVRYVPVMCVRAPCPSGNYAISKDKQRIGTFKTVVLTMIRYGEQELHIFTGRCLPNQGGIEGRLRIDDKTAYVTASRLVDGVWKP